LPLPSVALEGRKDPDNCDYAASITASRSEMSVPPLVPGAALPGVLDAATALGLSHRHGVAPGHRTVVIGTGRRAAVARRLGSGGPARQGVTGDIDDRMAAFAVDRFRRGKPCLEASAVIDYASALTAGR
jgi:hypothetical protein